MDADERGHEAIAPAPIALNAGRESRWPTADVADSPNSGRRRSFILGRAAARQRFIWWSPVNCVTTPRPCCAPGRLARSAGPSRGMKKKPRPVSLLMFAGQASRNRAEGQGRAFGRVTRRARRLRLPLRPRYALRPWLVAGLPVRGWRSLSVLLLMGSPVVLSRSEGRQTVSGEPCVLRSNPRKARSSGLIPRGLRAAVLFSFGESCVPRVHGTIRRTCRGLARTPRASRKPSRAPGCWWRLEPHK